MLLWKGLGAPSWLSLHCVMVCWEVRGPNASWDELCWCQQWLCASGEAMGGFPAPCLLALGLSIPPAPDNLNRKEIMS